LKEFIRNGSFTHRTKQMEVSALRVAAYRESLELINLVFDQGVDVDVEGDSDFTTFDVPCYDGLLGELRGISSLST